MKISETRIGTVFILSAVGMIVATVLVIGMITTYIEQQRFKTSIDKERKTFEVELRSRIKEQVETLITSLEYEELRTYEVIKKEVRSQTLRAYSIATKIHQQLHQTHSKKAIKKIIIETLRDLRFNDGRGYILIDSLDGRSILMPPRPSMEGKSFYKELSRASHIMDDFKRIALEAGEGYSIYEWYKPGDRTQLKEKITYVKYLEAFDWIIASGEYVEDMRKQLQNETLARLEHIRFFGNGYFFVIDQKAKTLMNPNFRHREIDHDPLISNEVNKITKQVIRRAKEGGGYVKYQWYKPGSKQRESKLTYTRMLDAWGWAVSAGVYLGDFEKTLEKRIETHRKELISDAFRYGAILFIVGLSAFAISLLISRRLNAILNRYREGLKERNEALKELNTSLEERVEKEVGKVRHQEKLLIQQSKQAMMGEMLSVIAHQWRQPLNAISLNVQDLQDAYTYGEMDAEYLKRSVNQTLQQIDYMSHTIDDFRNFFKPSKTKEQFELKEVVVKTFELIGAQLSNHNITVRCANNDVTIIPHSDDAFVFQKRFILEGFKNEFQQVLLNIIQNAKDVLMEERNKNLSKPIIEVDFNVQDRMLRLEIADNGGEIPGDVMERMFDPYFTTKHSSIGTGLGLYMAKMIIEKNMHGKLHAYNREGWAVFVIEMPMIQEQAPQ